MRNQNKAFSLIELLFVIAIISLLAALLFPVFEKVREKARGISCLSNMKQIGMAIALYTQDYDETFPMNRFPDEKHSLKGCDNAPGIPYPMSGLEETRINWRRVLLPYIKNKQVYACPSNKFAMFNPDKGVPGDQTNHWYEPKDYLPLSYAMNSTFFHEAVPACWYGEQFERPRFLHEIDNSSNLIMLLESRLSHSGIGSWALPWSGYDPGTGIFQSHDGVCNFIFIDQHVKALKLAQTCTAKMWRDRFPDKSGGCDNLMLAEEYR